jgi:MFS family permease
MPWEVLPVPGTAAPAPPSSGALWASLVDAARGRGPLGTRETPTDHQDRARCLDERVSRRASVQVRGPLSPWHFVLLFGLVSLLTDMVYEGARSIIGPYLASLGASALVVGVVAGAGEFIGYGLRVVSGYLVQRSRHYWAWTITGYALTVLSVPLIGVTHAVVPALLLYGTERLGKAVRSPAKDTLLSHASTRTGRGAAFGVHQAMDQIGAVAGPLLLATVLAASQGDYRLAFAVLAVPGVFVLVLLAWLRLRVPAPWTYEEGPERESPAADAERTAATEPPAAPGSAPTQRLPRLLWQYVAAIGILSVGVAPFPLLALHAQGHGMLSTAQIPVLFAVAMAVDGVSGLVAGPTFDRAGPRVLLVVPVAAAGAAVSFADRPVLVWVGVAVWGVVNGILDSVVKAAITQLVGPGARATAFGWLALVRGAGLLVGGAALGLAYEHGTGVAVTFILVANLVGLIALARVLRAMPRPR